MAGHTVSQAHSLCLLSASLHQSTLRCCSAVQQDISNSEVTSWGVRAGWTDPRSAKHRFTRIPRQQGTRCCAVVSSNAIGAALHLRHRRSDVTVLQQLRGWRTANRPPRRRYASWSGSGAPGGGRHRCQAAVLPHPAASLCALHCLLREWMLWSGTAPVDRGMHAFEARHPLLPFKPALG